MSWIRQLFSRRRRFEELAESMREHLSEKVEELVEGGMAHEDAEFRAKREFGNVTRIEERSREVWQWPTVESIWADVKFALRQLVKAPGFTVTAVLTLALGIAVNATMFSLVSAFLLPRLPGRDAQKMVVVSSVDPDGNFLPDVTPVSAPNYLAWRGDTRVFSEMAAADESRAANLAGTTTVSGNGGSLETNAGQPESVEYAAVSLNYFSVFGVAPQLGRDFAAGEDQAGRDHEVILSHGLWVRRFGSDPAVVGRRVRLDREDYEVVGVMGPNFRLMGFTPQLWTPLTLKSADETTEARRNRSLTLFSRLQPGVTLKHARAEMTTLARRNAEDFPATEKRWGAAVRMLPDYLVYAFSIRNALVVIMTVVGFVLLIACANVAALLLTRAAGRQKELAIRVSMGASRARVARQLLTEGLVIALAVGAVGLALTYVGIGLMRASLTFNEAIGAVPLLLDRNVLLFAVGISLGSAVLSSLVPALKASHTDVNTDLKSESRGSSGGRSHSRLRAVLVGAEIAMALLLLIGTSVLIRGLYALEHQTLGFRRDHLLTAGVALDRARYSDASKDREFVRELMPRLQQIPGVVDAAVASDLPAGGPGSVVVRIQGQAALPPNEQRTALDVVVSQDYFQVAGVPVMRGRAFTEMDEGDAPRVVVVNQEFAHRYLQDHDPLGKQVQLDIRDTTPAWSEIVGVVSDVKNSSEGTQVDPEVYEAFLQRPVGSFSILLRSSVEPGSLARALRQAVDRLDDELPLLRVMTMERVIEYQRSGNPLFEQLLAIFAALALMLAAIGIYGLVAYSVSQRTNEIGIRLALGAKGSDISRMILVDGLKVAAIGAGIGLVLALPLPKVFNSIFVGIIRFDVAGVYPMVAAAMLLVVVIATYAPARRAARVDPMRALRSE
ncbi:MAG: ABC transporter permease [Acidobacteriaceae bacterium]